MVRSARQENGEAGSALVEFALATVLILTVLFGIVEMGRALYCFDWVSDAARRGSRYAMVRGQTSCNGSPHLTDCEATPGTPSTPGTIAYYVVSNGFGIDRNMVTLTATCWPNTHPTPAPCPTGTPVIVTVNYPFQFILPFLPHQPWTMRSSSARVVAQ